MKAQRVLTLILIVLLIFLLISLEVASNYINTSNTSHLFKDALKLSKIIGMIVCAGIMKRFVDHFVIAYYENKLNKKISHVVSDLLHASILLLLVMSISVFVFQKHLTSIIAAGGIMSGILIFSLKTTIVDTFSKILLEIERPYEIGDWITLTHSKLDHNKLIGEVLSINWRTTRLRDLDESIYIIPNGELTKHPFQVYKSGRFLDMLEIEVDRMYPIERVQRILESALLRTPYSSPPLTGVFAQEPTYCGIKYYIRYQVENYHLFHQARHDVLSMLVNELFHHDMNICEATGVRRSEAYKPITIQKAPLPNIAMKKISIFHPLSEEEINSLCEHIKIHTFQKDEIIVSQGNTDHSMFVIVEGCVKIINEKLDKVYSILKNEDYFGEMGLLLGQKRNATAQAVTTCLIYEIQKEDLSPILKSNPDLFSKLSLVITQRLTEDSKLNAAKRKTLKQNSHQQFLNELTTEMKKFFGFES